MKATFATSPLNSSNDMTPSIMGMDASGMDMACYFLRDKIYSNKILAVVREYICNALDEHIKYDVTKPVEVKIDKNTFSVRDFAKGLNENDIRNIFGMYFRSTKTDTNLQSGMYGIGSKSLFCYTDTFFVKSHFEGTCTLYACALGGGSAGVPVGQILRVSEEFTKESGLEISAEIKNSSDVQAFDHQIKSFIRHCTLPIVYNDGVVDMVPLIPEITKEIDGFTFRLYDSTETNGDTVFLTMGNVCYQKREFTTAFTKIEATIVSHKNIVVDIPIGMMAIPISRENFDNTPANQRVHEQIQKAFIDLRASDLNNKMNFSIQELLDTRDEIMLNGEFLCCHKRGVYSSLFPVLGNIRSCNISDKIEEKDGKKIVALIPSKSSSDYWRDKLIAHSKSINKNYFYLEQCILESSGLDLVSLNEFFIFKNVKSTIFKWPKISTADKLNMDAPFNVRVNNSQSARTELHKFNALELHNHARILQGKSLATDLEDAAEQMNDIDFEDELNFKYFVIASGTYNNNYCVFNVASKRMAENMTSLGWIMYGSPIYHQFKKIVNDKKEARLAHERKIDSIKIKIVDKAYESRLIARIIKKDRYIEKFQEIMEKLQKEDSLRSKIFKIVSAHNGYTWNYSKISRAELRKILLIK
jgi:hypothetical protein